MYGPKYFYIHIHKGLGDQAPKHPLVSFDLYWKDCVSNLKTIEECYL